MQKDVHRIHWKVRHKNTFGNNDNFLEEILLTDGVKEDQIDQFLKPTKKNINDPFLMKNMQEAIELVHSHLEKNSKIFVKVDCDVDGFTSASTLIQFLQKIKPGIMIDYGLSYEKQHGLFYQDVSRCTRKEYGLIIVPDASAVVRDIKAIRANFDADILVMDHHLIQKEFFDKEEKKWIPRDRAKEIYSADKDRLEVDCYTNYCICINCTDGQYPNPDLSGAGVVQKFIEAYTLFYSTKEDIPDCREDFLDLVSLGLVADNMDLRSLEDRYYVLQGFKDRNCHNEFINELVKRNEEDMKWGRYIISMGWSIAPKINGCIRYGKPEEQENTFRAILGEQEIIEYQPKRKHKDDPLPPKEQHTLQEAMARVCENVKARQDTEVRKFVKEIDTIIETEGLNKNSILFIDGTKILERGTVSGLVASKLASKYLRPALLMRSKNATEFGGSARNYAQGEIENLNEFLTSMGISCSGHASAFGISFPKEKLSEIIEKCNKAIPLESLVPCYQCDWEIAADDLKKEYIQSVAENYEVFGSTVPAPLFAITGIKITAGEIHKMGDSGSFIRFSYKGIPFIKKYCPHEDYDNLILKSRKGINDEKKELDITIIGEFVLSKWENQIIPEVKIIDFQSTEIKKTKKPEEKNISKDMDFDW